MKSRRCSSTTWRDVDQSTLFFVAPPKLEKLSPDAYVVSVNGRRQGEVSRQVGGWWMHDLAGRWFHTKEEAAADLVATRASLGA